MEKFITKLLYFFCGLLLSLFIDKNYFSSKIYNEQIYKVVMIIIVMTPIIHIIFEKKRINLKILYQNLLWIIFFLGLGIIVNKSNNIVPIIWGNFIVKKLFIKIRNIFEFKNFINFESMNFNKIITTILISGYVLTYIIYIFIHLKKTKKVLKNNKNLIDNRKSQLEMLKNEINSGVSSILIDDIWGSGKTFFIKEFIKNYENEYNFIYLKTPYFELKSEFRKKLLSEINRIFLKNGILSSALIGLTKYFNISIKGIGVNTYQLEYSEIIEKIKNDLNNLDNKLVLVLDDLDRIEKEGNLIEFFNFIGELKIDLGNKIVVIILSSSEKLIQNLRIDDNKYLEKYFDKSFLLRKSEIFDLIDLFCKENNIVEDTKLIIYKIINNIQEYKYSEIIDLKKYGLNNQEKIKEDNEKIEKLRKEYNSRKTFRNVERIIKNIKRIENLEKLDEDNKEIFMICEIVEVLLPEEWEKLKNKEKSELQSEESIIKRLLCKEIFFYEKQLEIKFDIFYSIKQYKFSNQENYYYNILNLKKYLFKEISKEELGKEVQDITCSEYEKVAELFKFNSDENRILLKYFLDNIKNKCDFFGLYIKYKLNYKLVFGQNIDEFLKEVDKIEENGKIRDANNVIYYNFIKECIVISGLISIDKIFQMDANREEMWNLEIVKENIEKYIKEHSEGIKLLNYLYKMIKQEPTNYDNFKILENRIKEIFKTEKEPEQKIVEELKKNEKKYGYQNLFDLIEKLKKGVEFKNNNIIDEYLKELKIIEKKRRVIDEIVNFHTINHKDFEFELGEIKDVLRKIYNENEKIYLEIKRYIENEKFEIYEMWENVFENIENDDS